MKIKSWRSLKIKDVLAYIVGNLRYKLYYSSFKWLIRKHIREQIDYRIRVMRKECYDKGECVMCGCSTTALQMADKTCLGLCYPPLLSNKSWKRFNNYEYIEMDTQVAWKKNRVSGLPWVYCTQYKDNTDRDV